MRWIWSAALAGACASCGATEYDLDAGDQSALGAAFVAERNCASCHQSPDADVLSGGSAPVAGTRAFAPNLTPDHATGVGDWADIQIVRAIRAGVDNESVELCAAMPRYDGSRDGGVLVPLGDATGSLRPSGGLQMAERALTGELSHDEDLGDRDHDCVPEIAVAKLPSALAAQVVLKRR
jgi:hypothetical protein